MINQTTTTQGKFYDVNLVDGTFHVMYFDDSWCSPHTPLLFPFWNPRCPVSCTTPCPRHYLFIIFPVYFSLSIPSLRGFFFLLIIFVITLFSDLHDFYFQQCTLLIMLYIHTRHWHSTTAPRSHLNILIRHWQAWLFMVPLIIDIIPLFPVHAPWIILLSRHTICKFRHAKTHTHIYTHTHTHTHTHTQIITSSLSSVFCCITNQYKLELLWIKINKLVEAKIEDLLISIAGRWHLCELESLYSFRLFIHYTRLYPYTLSLSLSWLSFRLFIAGWFIILQCSFLFYIRLFYWLYFSLPVEAFQFYIPLHITYLPRIFLNHP